MLRMDVPYGITKRLPKTTPAEARERIQRALSAEGFGVLTEIDVQKTLEAKIGARIDPYVILGACNPSLAHRALQAEPALGLLLPCNVVVAADGEDAVISAASPRAMFAITGARAELEGIAGEVEEKIRRAVDKA